MTFRIVIDSTRVEQWMRKIPKNIRKRGRSGLRQFGNHLVSALLLQANAVGIQQFRRARSMFTSTRYVQRQNEGFVFMPKSGLYQDRAKPHYVTVSRNKPMLYAWARQRGFTGTHFLFRPKPFINRGIRNSLTRLMPIMRPQVKAAIRESH